MKKRFTILFGAFCALMILISMPGKAVGQSTTYTSNVTLPSVSSPLSACTVEISENSYDGIKIGTSKNPTGSFNITVPAGTTKLYVHAAAWTGKNSTLSVTTNANGVSITPNTAWSLTADSGISGNGSSYTLNTPGNASTSYFKEYTLSGVTSDITITIANGTERAVVWGINTSSGSLTQSNLAITGDPVALSFDLYNNSSAQTVSYTTSSTGAITITPASPTSYFSYVHNAAAKTITVTPIAVTPSAQTITVNQAADATYAAGSVTFTVTISDSTPIPTHTVTYSVNGSTTTEDFEEGATITFPANPSDIYGKTFVGWTAAAINGTTNTAPTFVTSATMGDSDVTYYAVFATVTGTSSDSWTETALGSMTSSDVFVIAAGSYAMSNNNGTSSAPSATSINVSGITLTGTISDNLKWNVSGNATNGYTFYPNGSTTTWLYCNTTDASGSNNNIRVGTGNRKVWEINANEYLVTKDNSTVRYLSIYNNQDFRGYVNTSNGAFVPTFYKFIAGSTTYGNYCTTVVITYTLTYDGNGATSGNVPAESTAYNSGAPVTVLGPGTLAKTGCTFTKWTTESNGDGDEYQADDKITINGNTTLYAQWTAVNYTITTEAAENTVTVVSTAHFEETVTITVNPPQTQLLTSLTVTGDDSHDAIAITPTNANEYTFTMPAENVTIAATFGSSYTVTYSVNGNTSAIAAQVVEPNGNIANLPTPASVPTGYTFTGWTADEASTETILTGSYTPTANVTLYAVFQKQITVSKSMTIDKDTKNFPSGTYGTANTFTEYTLNGKNFKIQQVYINGGKLQFRAAGNSNGTGTIYNNENFGTITSIVLNYNSSDTNKNFTINAGSSANPTDGTSITPTSVNSKYTFDLSGSSYTYFVLTNGDYAGYLDNIIINYTVEQTVYYTFVKDITENVTMANISATNIVTVKNGYILTLTGTNQGDETNLIIEDGGQLITSSANVKATVKKNITAPSAWTQDNKTGWYAISSTVGTISDITSSSFSNDFAPAGDFDLYKYVESSNNGYGWINYNNPAQTSTFGGLVNGQGYLYARKDGHGTTVSFKGNVNHTDVTLTGLTANNTANVNLQGIHFVGNPYTHNIYKGVALTATAGGMAETYYRLDGNNLWVVESDDTPIGPGQGFLVKVTENNTSLTFSNNASSSKANNDYIRFAVSNSEYEDATFALFQKGEGLRKINHRNTEAPMIYISQNDANYASATMDDDTKSFNLNFEAKTMGQYKLSYKVNGEFNYLHVIDRATGEDIDMLLEGSYSFIGSPMDNAQRFIVRLGYLPNYEDNGEDIFAYQSGNDIVVSGEGELQIFDVMGRKVSTMNIYGIETVNGLAQGVYIFRLEGKTQKIVVR